MDAQVNVWGGAHRPIISHGVLQVSAGCLFIHRKLGVEEASDHICDINGMGVHHPVRASG
jgi:hypothetical protein